MRGRGPSQHYVNTRGKRNFHDNSLPKGRYSLKTHPKDRAKSSPKSPANTGATGYYKAHIAAVNGNKVRVVILKQERKKERTVSFSFEDLDKNVFCKNGKVKVGTQVILKVEKGYFTHVTKYFKKRHRNIEFLNQS